VASWEHKELTLKKPSRSLSDVSLIPPSVLPVEAQAPSDAENRFDHSAIRIQSSVLANDSGVASGIKLLETLVESSMAYRNQPGLSIGIVNDQQLVWAKGFGYSDVERKVPATPSTLYRIGSITKLFTATAIMQLRDQGKLRLDDPIVKHLPWFKIKSRFPAGPAITVRQLLSHSSGLPSEAAFPYWTDYNFPSREQIIESLPRQEVIFEPETRLKYSNLNYFLLAEIISTISEESYADYVKRHILDPLKMKDTSVDLTEAEKNRVSIGYGRLKPGGKRDLRPFQNMRGMAAAGNMSSTVADMARFASLQFADAHSQEALILKPATIREMRQVQAIRPDWRGGFGFGFTLRPYSNGVYIGHEGWIPGYRARMRIAPEEKIAVIVLANSDDADTPLYTDQAFELVGPALRKAAAAPARQAEPVDPEWQQYVGKYTDPWTDYEVLILNQELVLVNLGNGSMVKLAPEGRNSFRIIAPIADGILDGDVVSFESGPDGRVTRIKIGENYTSRRD
jgi:CubicO group peptidase (beta-lactamase class C family)